MKLRRETSAGFSVGELLICAGMTMLLLGASFTTLASLQRTFTAADNYFATHIQQIRMVDYLSRDVKRSTAVTTSADRISVTCSIPAYVVNSGEADALSDSTKIGIRRTPAISFNGNGAVVDYGRSVTDAVTTQSSTTLTSATAKFTSADVGHTLIGNGYIKPGTTIQSVTGASSCVMSQPALQTGTSISVTVVAAPATVVYSLNNQSILRSENGVPTTIAQSTDSLIPDTTDVEQANTEYAITNVTFLPSFALGTVDGTTEHGQQSLKNKRNGTAVYATSYLRNKRRG